MFIWFINHQLTVLFSQNKSSSSNQPAVFFLQNKSAPATSQTNRLTMTAIKALEAQIAELNFHDKDFFIFFSICKNIQQRIYQN
jgi:hypothetical protein